MTAYFVESYWPGVDERLLRRVGERLASGRSGQAGAVTWLISILVPEDEIVLCLAVGSSPEVIRASAQEAGMPTERIIRCVYVAPGESPVRPEQPRVK
jgi:hypothetical protein